MIASDELFQLIKSLSPSEKRYFKVFAARHSDAGDNSYVLLFDQIDKQDEYDEEKLRKKLKRNVSANAFAAEKKYLLSMIMRAMRTFHSERSVDSQIHELLHDEAFFHGKGLNDLREKTLYKAKKLAQEYEKFPSLLIILQREANMLIERKTKDYDEVRSRVHKEENEVVKKIINEFEFRILKDDVFIDTRTEVNVRDASFLKMLDGKIAQSIMKDEKNAISL